MRTPGILLGFAVWAAVFASPAACGGGSSSSAGADGGGDGTSGSSSGSSSSSGGGSGAGSSSGASGGSSGGSDSGSESGGVDAGIEAGAIGPGDSVLMQHKNINRDGLYVQPSFTKAALSGLHKDPTFSVSLPDPNDQIFGQPLFVDGLGVGKDLVIVATEGNNVYALDAASGAPVWTKNLGPPVPKSTFQCGNLPTVSGITGTPAIDWQSRTLFVDALVLGSAPQHHVFALSIDTGAIASGWPVTVDQVAKMGTMTFDDTPQGERGGLLVLDGWVYVPFGGMAGDCGAYHGWVVGISISDPTKVVSWATTWIGGGIWAPAGISSDGTSLFVSTGNTFVPNQTVPWGGGDGVVSFVPGSSFARAGFFAPTEWLQLDKSDLDMGTTPLVFDQPGSTPSRLALAFGKDGDAYLLDRQNLPGVGAALGADAGQTYTSHVATMGVVSAPVLYTTPVATYVVYNGIGTACTNGTSGMLTALEISSGSPPTLEPSWCAGNSTGSPIVTTSDGHADGVVWDFTNTGSGPNRTFVGSIGAYDADTGKTLTFTTALPTIVGLRSFNAPIAAKGRIFVPADNTVVALTL